MPRIAHGSTFAFELEDAPKSNPFDYLFADLQKDPDSLLPPTQKTLDDLTLLGREMLSKVGGSANGPIPSAYTYFGQFVNHDIAFTDIQKDPGVTDSCMLGDPHLTAWTPKMIQEKVMNRRAAVLALDSVYGKLPRILDSPPDPLIPSDPPRDSSDSQLMLLHKVSNTGGLPIGKDDENDLPRLHRRALIAEPRNDTHLMISQLHVAFLRAHNKLVKKYGYSFEKAQTTLRQHYHWIIVKDYLPRIADQVIIKNVLARHWEKYRLPTDQHWVPLEFTMAAFRFGHSMIRDTYYIRNRSEQESLKRLFMLTVLSNGYTPPQGQIDQALPADYILRWRQFLDVGGGLNFARPFSTYLAQPLGELLDENEQPVHCERLLSVQDLKRSFMMRIPTGQAVAKAMGLKPLVEDDFGKVVSGSQLEALISSGFINRTPLWFYILAEAALTSDGKFKGAHLGDVGSRLVAEVLIGLVLRFPDSFLNDPKWKPTLPSKGDIFSLSDLLAFAGVLEPET